MQRKFHSVAVANKKLCEINKTTEKSPHQHAFLFKCLLMLYHHHQHHQPMYKDVLPMNSLFIFEGSCDT